MLFEVNILQKIKQRKIKNNGFETRTNAQTIERTSEQIGGGWGRCCFYIFLVRP